MSVWQWYQLGDRVSHSRYEAKLLELTGLLSQQPALVVAIATDGDEADGVLASFLEAYGGVLRNCLAGQARAADCRPVPGE